ncbi:MAG: DUF4139 domain-containing protein [Flavobacteriales bacterium]|nr:DUF4139 domain-containing protein [Flavobacteriales bacterium]
MKKLIILAIALFTCMLQVSAQALPKAIPTKTTDVTIFMAGAQITETANVQLKEGENLLRISDLTLYLDPNSIQVEGGSNFTILSVRHQINYLVDQNSNPKVKVLQDSLDNAYFKQKEIAGLKDVIGQEKAMLEYNRNIKGDNAVLLSEDLKDMADFYRTRYTELAYKWIELGEKERLNNAEISRLQTALNSLNARKGTNPSEILITVISEKAQTTPLRVSYFAQSAGWYPIYDLRADDVNSPIQFAYRAKVYQSTGRDWDDVNLTISTGNPNIGGQVPELYPWYVNIYEPIPVTAMDKKGNYRARAEAPAAYGGNVDDNMLEEVKVMQAQTAANYTTMQSNTVSTEFKISIPYDIPSDNQQYDVTMQSQTLKATYAYVTIPKLDNDAFLRAQITDWAQYSLLPGESNIYFKGTYVGKGYIDPALANDTLNLSLGRDKAISVKRDQIKDYCKTSMFGGKQKTSKAYEITIQNNKKQSVEIIIEDQIPISQNGDVEVETEDISGGVYDAVTGKVVWKLTLSPNETVKKQLRFNVKYPKKKYVTGL